MFLIDKRLRVNNIIVFFYALDNMYTVNFFIETTNCIELEFLYITKQYCVNSVQQKLVVFEYLLLSQLLY